MLLMSLIQSGIKKTGIQTDKKMPVPCSEGFGDGMIQYAYIYIIPPQSSEDEPVKKRKQQLKAFAVMVYREDLGPPCIN